MTETVHTVPATVSGVAPDVGDRFRWGGVRGVFAVVGWLRLVALEPLPSDLAALFPDQSPRDPLLVFCLREDAEFVVGYGVGGVVAPVGEVAVVGRVGWPESHVVHARRRAVSVVGEFVRAC